MKMTLATIVASAAAGTLASGALAAEILVTSDITTSTTWTSGNTYNLQGQIYVSPGATLTIQPGTILASTTNIGGSLSVCRGARIIAIGTQENPIVFTSKADVATWTAGNPKTGTWRAACNEWGALTLMGAAYISENAVATNTAAPNAANYAVMEGLVSSGAGDTRVLYGGGNDDDNSGTLSYCTFRYGGKVIGLANELNGLSLGGCGRETHVDHMEIMNNVDDGIETWGGTVDYKYCSIWNIGDDCFDVDQGWRGKAQFMLMVAGYSQDAAQGSGVTDNGIEMDGAEQSDYQPVTAGCIYNATLIGNPGTNASGSNGSDQATAWRDNCNMQIRQSIFMQWGEMLVKNDNVDGDGGAGYGFNGTLTFAQRWATSSSFLLGTDAANKNAPANPVNFYKSQLAGNLCEIYDSVAYDFPNTTSVTIATIAGPTNYNQADQVGFSNAAMHNVKATTLPIASITRGRNVLLQTGLLGVKPVTKLDPRAANDAVTAFSTAPNNGFFEPVNYRGAFSSTDNWLCNWSASDAFGFLAYPAGFTCSIVQPCPADLNGDGIVNASDLAGLLGGWGTTNGDVDGSGTTDAADLAALLGAWGNCP